MNFIKERQNQARQDIMDSTNFQHKLYQMSPTREGKDFMQRVI